MAKAKRKLNTTFIVAGAGVIVGVLAIVGGLGYHKLRQGNPAKWESLGKTELAQGKYEDAYNSFLKALSKRQTDPELLKLVGDTCNDRTTEDPEMFRRATKYYEMALEVDPKYLPALHAELDQTQDAMDQSMRLSIRAGWADNLQKISKRLLAADPKDPVAIKADAISSLEQYLDGTQIDPKRLDAAMEEVKKLAKASPADSMLPFYMARVRFVQGEEAANNKQIQLANQRLTQAKQIMDEALKGQENNAGMLFRSAMVNFRRAYASANIPAAKQAAVLAELTQLKKAYDLVKPDDPAYTEIRFTYASQLGADKTMPLHDRVQMIESIYRDLVKRNPEDISIKLALADMLGRTNRRQEAIAMLKEKYDSTPKPGMRGVLMRTQDFDRLVILSKVELDEFLSSKDEAERKSLLAELDTNVLKLTGSPDVGQTPAVLYIKGRLELVHGDQVEGIQTLSHALQLSGSNSGMPTSQRIDILYTLAKAELDSHQTGEAQQLAEEIVRDDKDFLYGQLLLTDILLRNHDIAGATAHIEALEKMAPTEPVVIMMRLQSYDTTKDQDKIHAGLAKLPTKTRSDIVETASAASRFKAYDVAEKLLLPLTQTDKPDMPALELLASDYYADGKKAEAKALLAAAHAKSPDDARINVMIAAADGQTGAQLRSTEQAALMKLTDPYQREVSLAELARQDNDAKTMVQHLEAAEKIRLDEDKVEDPRLVLEIFQCYLSMRDWDNAAKYREKLVKIDPNGMALSTEARFDLARGGTHIAEAADVALKLTRERPEFAGSWVILGMVRRAQGPDHLAQAVTNFQQAVDKQVDNVEGYRGLIDCYDKLKQPKEAKRCIDLACKVFPDNQEFKDASLNWEIRFGDPQKAIQPRLDEVAAKPDDESKWIHLAQTYVAVAQHKAENKDDAGAATFYGKAADSLAQAIAKWPDDGMIVSRAVGTRAKAGDFAGAEKLLMTWAARDAQKGKPDTIDLEKAFYVSNGHLKEAEDVVRDYLKTKHTDGSDLVMAWQLSQVLTQDHKLDEALAVLPADVKEPGIVKQRVLILLSQHKPELADKALSDSKGISTDLTPDEGDLKVQILMMENHPADAKELLDKILAPGAAPDDVSALKNRARVTLAMNGDPDAAMADLARARDLAPNDVDTRLMLAEVDRGRNRPQDAAKELEAAVLVSPDNKQIRLRLIDIYMMSNPPQWIEAHQALADARKQPDMAKDPQFDAAEAQMDLGRGETTAATPDDLANGLAAAQKAVAGGYGIPANDRVYLEALLRNKRYDDLITESEKITAADKDQWWIHVYRAQAMVGRHDRGTAMAEFGKALDASGADLAAIAQTLDTVRAEVGVDFALQLSEGRANADIRYRILSARYREVKGDIPGALKWAESAISAYDKLSRVQQEDALRIAGELYLAVRPQQTHKAVDAYRKLLEMAPNDIVALNNLACVLVDPGPESNPAEALKYSRHAYDLKTAQGQFDPSVMDTHGWVLICNGQIADGIGLIRDALNHGTDFADAHYHLGSAFLKQNAADTAVKELQRAQDLISAAEKQNKPVDDLLKAHVAEALHRAKVLSTG